ncbi:MAG: carbon monoxide dehydrogenase subunit G [Granulosicoccus sp.]|nr:carbon monoxide dehydrogenase subunit G [Granulosicoccus sp.]
MNLQEEVLIPRDRQTVFEALNNIDILKASIPGCQELTWMGQDDLQARIVVKFGPVKANFLSKVTLDSSNGPEQFSLKGTGDAGAAGSATGGADVQLVEQGENTLLRYEAKIDVVGKLAQLSIRLIEGTSRKLAKQFFVNFADAIQSDTEAP